MAGLLSRRHSGSSEVVDGGQFGARKQRTQGIDPMQMCANFDKTRKFREDQFGRIAHPACRHHCIAVQPPIDESCEP